MRSAKEIMEEFDEIQKMYENARKIAKLTINLMRECNDALMELTQELEKVNKNDGATV